jgi:hypothetical protein
VAAKRPLEIPNPTRKRERGADAVARMTRKVFARKIAKGNDSASARVTAGR